MGINVFRFWICLAYSSGLTISSSFYLLLRKPQALPPSLVLSQHRGTRRPFPESPMCLPSRPPPEGCPRTSSSGSVQRIFRAVKIPCTIGNDGYVLLHIGPNPQECAAPRVNPNVNYGLQAIMMCQCRLSNCSKCPTLEADAGGGCPRARAGGVWESPSLRCEPKTALKTRDDFCFVLF